MPHHFYSVGEFSGDALDLPKNESIDWTELKHELDIERNKKELIEKDLLMLTDPEKTAFMKKLAADEEYAAKRLDDLQKDWDEAFHHPETEKDFVELLRIAPPDDTFTQSSKRRELAQGKVDELAKKHHHSS